MEKNTAVNVVAIPPTVGVVTKKVGSVVYFALVLLRDFTFLIGAPVMLWYLHFWYLVPIPVILTALLFLTRFIYNRMEAQSLLRFKNSLKKALETGELPDDLDMAVVDVKTNSVLSRLTAKEFKKMTTDGAAAVQSQVVNTEDSKRAELLRNAAKI